MRIYSTVENAVKIAIDIFEAEHILVTTDSIRNTIYDWYEHTDVTDPEVLAACAIEGFRWYPGATYQEMLEIRDHWFPQDPYNEISIWDIEAAQYDMFW